MNLVDLIKGQLAGEVVGGLSRSIGVDQATVEKTLSALVPGVLASVAGLTSTSAGAEKVTKTLNSPDLGQWGDLASILKGGGAAKVQEKGGDLLSSLLGGGGLAAIVTALVKFANVDGKLVKGILGLVGPMILSTIAAQFKNRALTPSALSSLMTEQKANIANSLPPGFSIPDLSNLAPSAPAAPAVPGWLIPVVALGLLAAAGWFFLSGQPEAPAPVGVPPQVKPAELQPAAPKAAEVIDPATMNKDLADVFKNATEYLGTVKDVPTAEAIVPQVEGLNTNLDRLKGLYDKIPVSARAAIISTVTDGLPKFKDLVAKVLAIPGVGDKLKTILDGLVTKLVHFST